MTRVTGWVPDPLIHKLGEQMLPLATKYYWQLFQEKFPVGAEYISKYAEEALWRWCPYLMLQANA